MPGRTIAVSLLVVVVLLRQACSAEDALPTNIAEGWVATDSLGRTIAGHAEAGAPRADKQVAIFYWTWHTSPFINVETVNDISAPAAKWMMLLLDIDRDKKTGWEGYDFVLNRKAPRDGKSLLEKCAGRWKWNEVAEVDFAVRGNRMELSIPHDLLDGGRGLGDMELKWSDNMQRDGDIMDFYLHGDAAPSGRFNYLYRMHSQTDVGENQLPAKIGIPAPVCTTLPGRRFNASRQP